jgi:hypothetical protein
MVLRAAGNRVPVTAALAALCIMCATAKPAVPRASGRDSVRILAVWPDPANKLHPGETVKFHIKLLANLTSADSGQVGLVIQDQRGSNLKKGGPQSHLTVARGTETVEVWDEVTVPVGARWIDVTVPLFPEGIQETAVTDYLRFEVMR